MSQRLRFVFVFAFIALSLGTTASVSLAQSVPYKSQGTGGYFPATGDYSGTGVGTHLGNLTFSGNVAIAPTANPLIFDWWLTVPQETVAANGDTLLFSGAGQVELFPLDATTFVAIWQGDFVVEGGTGRFAGAQPADEPLQVVAINDPFTLLDPEWFFSWTVTGQIVLH
ncbi:MAG TPA: hypothetical protein VFF52_26735 [Isosphaeraceae bacterium]|nr:hypothetical protein [Isosphaeraceae bacterium]